MSKDPKDPKDSPELSRRQFMKRSGLAAGAVAGAAAVAIPVTSSPLHKPFTVVEENNVELPSNGKSVVIMGGGLAGLQTGVELSARGFKVTIIEKTGTPGGKLKTWRDKSFGPKNDPAKKDPNFKGYVREHGIHAIWGFYNNLREFLARYGWGFTEYPENSSIYLFKSPDGKMADWTLNSLPNPYGALLQAYDLDTGDFVETGDKAAVIQFLRKLLSFDFYDKKQREYLDSITFHEWAIKLGCPESFLNSIMDALVEMANFDNPDKASALALTTLWSNCNGAPQFDLKTDLYMNPPGETFLQPMVEYIEAHGGEIIYNAELTGIEINDGVVKSVTASQIGDGNQRVARCSICGAILGPNGAELTKCPFCGANGDMIKLMKESELINRKFDGDYFVSALDVPASRKFYADNLDAFGGKEYFKKINKLQSVHVYVANMWYEGQEFWSDKVLHKDGKPSADLFATGFRDLGITMNWSFPIKTKTSGEARSTISDYEGRNVSIIETQIANAEYLAGHTDKEIADRCHAELKTMMPDIPEMESFYVNRWRNYTACRVGDNANSPAVQSPVDNLLFVGDMPAIDHSAVFMEKTNVTSKMATNLLLDKIGQKEGKITILPSGTPGVVKSVVEAQGSVFPT